MVGITGANTGWAGLAGAEVAGGFISQHVALLRPLRVEPAWLAYSVFSHRAQGLLLGQQYGGTKQQLGLAELAELQIFVPSMADQRVHLAALDQARIHTATASRLLSGQIALFQERREALITAAVAGELDIPGAAA